MSLLFIFIFFFFFNDTATTEIYTLSLHDALPIYPGPPSVPGTYVPPRNRPLPDLHLILLSAWQQPQSLPRRVILPRRPVADHTRGGPASTISRDSSSGSKWISDSIHHVMPACASPARSTVTGSCQAGLALPAAAMSKARPSGSPARRSAVSRPATSSGAG